jgi:hypothetical protein
MDFVHSKMVYLNVMTCKFDEHLRVESQIVAISKDAKEWQLNSKSYVCLQGYGHSKIAR